MKNDYQKFMSGGGLHPPSPLLSQTILDRVERDLNPDPWRTFASLAGIHLFTALITLTFCPQFGFRLVGEGMGLMHVFMKLGYFGCAVACGLFFVGMTIVIASIILSREQIRSIRRHQVLELGALVMLSLGAFVMLDTDIVLGFALAWLFGSFIGGMITLELAWIVRTKAWS